MAFPLGHRQAVEVRPQPPLKHRVAVDVQVVGGDRGGQVGRGAAHEVGGIGRGDVLQHHLQARVATQKGLQVPLDEHRLAIKDVDLRVGDLAVDEQGQTDPLQRFEHRAELGEVAHAGGGIGGGIGGVELAGTEDAFGLAPLQLGRRDRVGEVGRHQRGEAQAVWHGGADPLPVGQRRRHGGDRGAEVGHHDRAGKLARRGRSHRLEQGPIAQVHVPVVRTAQGEDPRRFAPPFHCRFAPGGGCRGRGGGGHRRRGEGQRRTASQGSGAALSLARWCSR